MSFCRNAFRTAIVSSVLFSMVLLVSCPIRITEEMMKRVKDAQNPVITLESPIDGSSYASSVLVKGIVKDTTTPDEDPGVVTKLDYQILKH